MALFASSSIAELCLEIWVKERTVGPALHVSSRKQSALLFVICHWKILKCKADVRLLNIDHYHTITPTSACHLPNSLIMPTSTRRSAAPSPPAVTRIPLCKTESSTIHLGESATEARTSHHHPSWKDIIIVCWRHSVYIFGVADDQYLQECIHNHPDGTRSGVSRPTIKKYADATYQLESTKANATRLSRAIKLGVVDGTFTLPKGPSGKVKLSKPKIRTKAKTAPAAVATSKKVCIFPSSTGSEYP